MKTELRLLLPPRDLSLYHLVDKDSIQALSKAGWNPKTKHPKENMRSAENEHYLDFSITAKTAHALLKIVM